MDQPENQPAPGRSCQGCTLCCKLLGIKELAKPSGRWCEHCDVGRGCKIYETRPGECRTFHCAWLLNARMPAEWAPKDSRLVVTESGPGVIVNADPGRPGAWRKAPFYAVIRGWAKDVVPRGGQVLVREGMNITAILPDREKPLGVLQDNWVAVSNHTRTPTGIYYDVVVMPKDDPRAHAHNMPG